MNPLMRLTGFTQGSVASGPTSFANFLRTQAKLVQSVVDDLTPATVNWLDVITDSGNFGNNSAQVTGINDVLALRLTWTPAKSVFYVKTSASALASDDINNNPNGWSQILNGGVVFAINNTHIGFATSDGGTNATVRNGDTGNTLIDTFTVLDLGGA